MPNCSKGNAKGHYWRGHQINIISFWGLLIKMILHKIQSRPTTFSQITKFHRMWLGQYYVSCFGHFQEASLQCTDFSIVWNAYYHMCTKALSKRLLLTSWRSMKSCLLSIFWRWSKTDWKEDSSDLSVVGVHWVEGSCAYLVPEEKHVRLLHLRWGGREENRTWKC